MTQLIEYIQTAKEFADAYGIAHLDRLLALAETVPNSPKTQSSTFKVMSNTILEEVEMAGFHLNPWLKTLILSNNVEVVRDAIAVVEENRRRGIVRNCEGLLVQAIRNQWKPHISA